MVAEVVLGVADPQHQSREREQGDQEESGEQVKLDDLGQRRDVLDLGTEGHQRHEPRHASVGVPIGTSAIEQRHPEPQRHLRQPHAPVRRRPPRHSDGRGGDSRTFSESLQIS